MIFICLDDSRIISECSAFPILKQKDQVIFHIVLNQILDGKGSLNPVSFLCKLTDVRSLHKPFSIHAPHFKAHMLNMAAHFFNRNGQIAVHSQWCDRIPHSTALHLFHVTMETVDFIIALAHIYKRKSCFPHFHRHIRISLIHKTADNQYGKQKCYNPDCCFYDYFFHISLP